MEWGSLRCMCSICLHFLVGQIRSCPPPGLVDISRNVLLQSAQSYGMMVIMQKRHTRTAARRKEVTHERIVEAAARAIRRSGYRGTGVADIMKDAGLTHGDAGAVVATAPDGARDRKSTRLNSSHVELSYAVFRLKKKKHSRGLANGLH